MQVSVPLAAAPGLALYIDRRLWARLYFLALDLTGVLLIDVVLIAVADTTALKTAFTASSENHAPTS
jgi:hypothetical protein